MFESFDNDGSGLLEVEEVLKLLTAMKGRPATKHE